MRTLVSTNQGFLQSPKHLAQWCMLLSVGYFLQIIHCIAHVQVIPEFPNHMFERYHGRCHFFHIRI